MLLLLFQIHSFTHNRRLHGKKDFFFSIHSCYIKFMLTWQSTKEKFPSDAWWWKCELHFTQKLRFFFYFSSFMQHYYYFLFIYISLSSFLLTKKRKKKTLEKIEMKMLSLKWKWKAARVLLIGFFFSKKNFCYRTNLLILDILKEIKRKTK